MDLQGSSSLNTLIEHFNWTDCLLFSLDVNEDVTILSPNF